jgi:hypothetical protein
MQKMISGARKIYRKLRGTSGLYEYPVGSTRYSGIIPEYLAYEFFRSIDPSNIFDFTEIRIEVERPYGVKVEVANEKFEDDAIFHSRKSIKAESNPFFKAARSESIRCDYPVTIPLKLTFSLSHLEAPESFSQYTRLKLRDEKLYSEEKKREIARKLYEIFKNMDMQDICPRLAKFIKIRIYHHDERFMQKDVVDISSCFLPRGIRNYNEYDVYPDINLSETFSMLEKVNEEISKIYKKTSTLEEIEHIIQETIFSEV